MAECYQLAGAARFGISQEQFGSWLLAIAAGCAGPQATAAQRAAFCRTLHLSDLALAFACAAGIEAAWDECLDRYRQTVLWSARRLMKDEARARELTESLFADLFCSSCNEGKSKLRSFTGRGTLESWLKATLFQASVDLFRFERRFVSLEERLAPLCGNIGAPDLANAQAEALLIGSLRAAADELSAEERFLLAAYFVDHRNLSQIADTLRVHESTVSRRLAKILRNMRRSVWKKLRAQGVDHQSVPALLPNVGRELPFDLRELLFSSSQGESL